MVCTRDAVCAEVCAVLCRTIAPHRWLTLQFAHRYASKHESTNTHERTHLVVCTGRMAIMAKPLYA